MKLSFLDFRIAVFVEWVRGLLLLDGCGLVCGELISLLDNYENETKKFIYYETKTK